MRLGRIPGGDSLFRHSIKPESFKGKRFASEKLVYLSLASDGSILASVLWQRYAPTERHVHNAGCRTALRRNQQKGAEGRSGKGDRRVYCGAYQLKASAVRALVGAENLDEILSADVVHHIEEGEIAHANVRIILKPGVDIAGTKTAIIDRLSNVWTGPLRHKCDCDLDIDPHPSLDLNTPSAGPYFDTRSGLSRLWYLIRFQAHYWFWRSFCQNAIQ